MIFRVYDLFAKFHSIDLKINNNMGSTVKISLILILISCTLTSIVNRDGTLALTLYNDDFGMIKDIRQIQFDKG
jgi:hypothetical protein